MKVTAGYKIKFTASFDKTLAEVTHHLCKHVDKLQALRKIKSVVGHFATHVKQSPYMYSVCRQTLTLGVSKYREYNKDNLRLIYSVDEKRQLITVYLIVGQKQDLVTLLQDYVLIHLH
jgi:hypothetical protein